MSAFRLLYCFRGSLFRWSFFLYDASSAVSGCFGVFWSVTRSDLRFPFATGLPVGTSPLSFILTPSALPPVASSGIFVDLSLVFILLSVSGFHPLPSPFCLDSFLSPFLLWVVFPSIFSSFSLRSTSWGRRHGHSVSRPSIPTIASFLLYLRRSLSLSYSSIASSCSMLSGVFRFVLPELSSHFVLRVLLLSFHLGRPVSSRVPPWDPSHVLSFLRGPPLEPLSSCFLRDLSRKVLFLVSLAPARRVGELPAVSAVVSPSGEDLFLSYLPVFRAKSESEARPLPRSYCVHSLSDFVGVLTVELLLYPVSALRIYLAHTASLPSCPRALFISPRAPSCPLSQNALSFFLRDVIAESYSSSGLSLPSVSSSSSSTLSASSSRPRSSVRAHGVRGVTASWAFLSWRPLPGLLPLSLLLSFCLMFSSLLPRVSVWVHWWLWVPCYSLIG